MQLIICNYKISTMKDETQKEVMIGKIYLSEGTL